MAQRFDGGGDDDLEAELMDLESNEHAYLPPQLPILRHSSSGSMQSNSHSAGSNNANTRNSLGAMPAPVHVHVHPSVNTATSNAAPAHTNTPPTPPSLLHRQPTNTPQQQQLTQQQLLRAAVEQRHAVQQQARSRFQPSGSDSSSSSGSASFSSSSATSISALASSFVSSLGLRSTSEARDASFDEPAQRKQAALQAITQLRQQQIAARVLDARSGRSGWDAAGDAMTQMIAKLDAVVDASLDELQNAPAAVLWTQVLAELPPTESDYLAQAADAKFAEQMKYCAARQSEREVHACIAQHLSAILAASVPTRGGQSVGKAMRHSLGELLRDFRAVFLACYERVAAQHDDVAALAAVLPLVTADVLQFAAILVQLLLFKYAFVAAWKEHVRRCVLAVLFDLLQPTLHGLYVGAFRTEDAVMEDIASLQRSVSPAAFGIASVFRLDGSWSLYGSNLDVETSAVAAASHERVVQQYANVIYRLNHLATIRSPWAKVEALAGICREVDATIKAHYAAQVEQPPPEEININAEALRSILAFALVAAPSMCLHVFSQLVILSSYLPESYNAREEGFALATFTSAVRHVARLP